MFFLILPEVNIEMLDGGGTSGGQTFMKDPLLTESDHFSYFQVSYVGILYPTT